jgi:hypothetical protein
LKENRVSKRGMMKIGGFVGTIGAGAMLVATAVGGTGAWFTDSSSGHIQASTGHLNLNTSSTELHFDNLTPGDYKTLNVDYNTNASSGASDIWLVFDPTNAYVAQFTGAKGAAVYPDGGLGRYGHFAVKDASGATIFSSYNLAHDPNGGQECYNADGHGGNNAAKTKDDTSMGYCGVPSAIKVESNLANDATHTMQLTFGVTGRWTAQNAYVANVPFSVVATQVGVRPDAANF